MKEIFIICTTDSMISSFLLPYIDLFKKNGFIVNCVSSKTGKYFEKLQAEGINMIQVPFTRNPFTINNIKSYKILCKIIRNNNNKLIFCHEPVGGVMGRLISIRFHIPVIYMAHGFHFYKGAPIINWICYYPIEKIMSYFTDLLITINTEDYKFARKKMKAKRVCYLNGVGIDEKKYSISNVNRDRKRIELGIPVDAFVVISVGELNKNKNHAVVLKAIYKTGIKNIWYVIAGIGDKENFLIKKAKEYNVNLKLLGYRQDCAELYAISDVFCFPSYREGLSVALMEAMSSGLPVIASNIRGNVDLIDSKGGKLVLANDSDAFKRGIIKMYKCPKYRYTCGEYNKNKVKKFGIENVLIEFGNQIKQLGKGIRNE